MSKNNRNKHRQHVSRHLQSQPQEAEIDHQKVVPAEQKADSSTTTNHESEEEKGRSMRLKEFFGRSSLTDWLLAIFTGALVAAAIYQFIIMGGQLDVMRKDLRAWICSRSE